MGRRLPDLLQGTLEAERLRSARSLLALRAGLTLAFLGLSAAVGLVANIPGARARLPILAVYCALALALNGVSHRWPEITRYSWLAIAFVDIPMVYAFQRLAVQARPDRAPLIAGMTVAIYLLLLMAAQLSIRRLYLLLSATTAYAMLLLLFAAAPGVPRTVWLDALLLVAAAAVVGNHVSARHLALLDAARQEHQQVIALNEGLERRVAERTGALERALRDLRAVQAQIVHAEKMASIGRLAAGIAHELNNPINFIANSLTPIESAFRDVRPLLDLQDPVARDRAARAAGTSLAEVDDVFRTLRNGVQRARSIVAGLTAYARRDEGEPFREDDVGRLLDNAIVLLRYELEPRIEVERRYCRDSRLRCYPGSLVQLFVNLLSNAAQAIEGRGTITLTTSREARVLSVSIEDTGAGIAPDVLPKIFEPFFTTREVGRGTGLGLSIAHGIVERHRGRIQVDSAPARGTRVDLTFPLEQD